jgi:hypothetical protein
MKPKIPISLLFVTYIVISACNLSSALRFTPEAGISTPVLVSSSNTPTRHSFTETPLTISTVTQAPTFTDTTTVTLSPSRTITYTPSPTPSPTPSQTPTQTSTPTPTQTVTPTSTPTPTATSEPTYATLRGEVLELANCRYGPGAAYLYKYGLGEGSNLEVIGRNPLGTWILVQAIGGNNPCWVNAKIMKVKGDVMSVAPVDPDIILPWSPYYGPVTGVSAIRNGNEVTVFWDPVILKAGDDSEQVPYLIEAWVCVNSELVFTVVGAYAIAAKINDEPGCSEPSHGRIYAAEKHGYTPWVEIPWPSAK